MPLETNIILIVPNVTSTIRAKKIRIGRMINEKVPGSKIFSILPVFSVRYSHLFSARWTCCGYMGALEPCVRCRALDQICMTVLAYLPLELLRDPDPVSHPDFPCQLHIPIAVTGIFLEFSSSKIKKPVDSLVCHILCPVFLFFAHERSNCHGITNNVP